MPLNQIGRVWLCCTKSTLLQKNASNKLINPTRHFKRTRNNVKVPEEANLNPGSIETPFSNARIESGDLSVGRLWKPLLFTVGFSGASFVGCSIWEYESMRSHAVGMIKKPAKFLKKQFERTIDKSSLWSKESKRWWNTLTPGEKVFFPICVLNVAVFGAWRVPRLQQFMLRYFASNPASSSKCLPMVLSSFSHYSGLHLLANMYVLHSFSTGAVHGLGKEQFVNLYLTAGVVSSFTSYLFKCIKKTPGLSVGASGSIMAVLAYVCMQYPETQLGIILLPFFTFSAGMAIKFIVGLDTAGVLMGWRFFDHAAHLGGAATGIVWATYGNQIWPKREPILRYWHEMRGSIK